MSALGGVARYEFLMQLRRRTLWIGFLLLSAVLVVAFFSGSVPYLQQLGAPHHDLMVAWAFLANTFFALGAGLFLADRFPRDRRIRVQELFAAGPAGPARGCWASIWERSRPRWSRLRCSSSPAPSR